MNIRPFLSVFILVVPSAVAQDRSDMGFFPFVKGRYWLYDGTVKFVHDSEVREKTISGWKSEVVDTVEGKVFKAALLKGSPMDLAWYQENKERADVLFVLTGDGEFIRIFSKAAESFAQIKSAGKLPDGFSDDEETLKSTNWEQTQITNMWGIEFTL